MNTKVDRCCPDIQTPIDTPNADRILKPATCNFAHRPVHASVQGHVVESLDIGKSAALFSSNAFR
ncbi:hypothetical protein EBAPG3_14985 [Nitrosospira lacus]|uniref:Uncharacterized protein n=1 Tax=Nitrosospira lacus TaxID=1288494 RepID=A0A1W6SLB4_9PROT|nr:hypothetical protein EBAPG3_14985 [Nitrosospira lacus]